MTTAVLSDYLEQKIINHVLRNTTYTSPGTSIYVALYTSNPTDANSGTEVSGTGYARVQVTAWDAPSGRATANTNAINFAQAGSNWGTVTHIGIHDHATAGNLLLYGELTSSRVVNTGGTFSLAAGDIDISLAGAYTDYLSHKLIDHILRNTAYTSPGTAIWAALHTADPTSAMTGAEVSGNNYARVQVSTWADPGSTSGATSNSNAITFNTPSGSWGTITHCALRDAQTNGNGLFFGAVGSSFAPTSPDLVEWNAGDWDITVS